VNEWNIKWNDDATASYLKPKTSIFDEIERVMDRQISETITNGTTSLSSNNELGRTFCITVLCKASLGVDDLFEPYF